MANLSNNSDFSNVSLDSNVCNSSLDSSVENNEIKHPRIEIINKLMYLYSKHRIADELLKEIASLINLVPSSIKLPTNINHLMEEFQLNNKHTVIKSILCKRCNHYSIAEDYNRSCKNSTCQQLIPCDNPYILNLGIGTQLKSTILRNFEAIQEFKKNIIASDGDSINDAYSGSILKELLKKNKDFIYALCLCTDGAQAFNSNSFSIWPVFLSCLFLPKEIRFKKENLIVASLYLDSKKPNFV